MKHFIFLTGVAASLFFTACTKNNLQDNVDVGTLQLESNLNYLDAHYDFLKDRFVSTNLFKGNSFNPQSGGPNELNKLTNEGITLGRVLFYDPRLSANNMVSCASCHAQTAGFARNNEVIGVVGTATSRTTMPLASAAFELGYFWGNNSAPLQAQILDPVMSHVEMGISDLSKLSEKIASIEEYNPLFLAAFGTEDVNSDRISHALTQFVSRISATQTKFDQQSQSFGSQQIFTQQELHGQAVFNAQCGNCHNVNIGTSAQPVYYDMQLPVAGGNGISFASNVGLDETDPLKANAIGFKIPNLRNVTLTAPYMHDGRFKTLEEVIEHYNSGVKDNPNLDPRLRGSNGLPKKMGLTPFDKSSLIAFLNTLTDESVATDTRFSNPFK